MSTAASTPSASDSSAQDKPRSISRFLWINVIATTLGCAAMALTFNHVWLLLPAVFGVLTIGSVAILREMFVLIGDDTYGDDAPQH